MSIIKTCLFLPCNFAALCLIFGSGIVKAETVYHSVSVQSIDNQLSDQFPFSKSFQNVRVIFSEPKAVINALDKTLKLQMMITSSLKDEMLLSKATFKGDITYDDFSDAYLFDNVRLDKLKIQIDSFQDSHEIVKAIKQSLINDFEDIVLVNLEAFRTELPNRQADSIDISVKQVRFIWNL